MKTLNIAVVAVCLLVASQAFGQTVTITKPTNQDAVNSGDTLTIKWTTKDIKNPTWKFFLDASGKFDRQLSPTPVDDGNGKWHADWTVPSGISGNCRYTIVVKDDTAGVDDHSGMFCINDKK